MIRALGLASIAIGLLTSGCGGDSSQETTQPTAVSIPTITSPIPTTSTTSTTTEPTTTEATTTVGKKQNGADPNKPDSPGNDVPPPAGSPQEAFEEHCQQNPEACG
ncbi:MAG TPA: hypothetical protein VFN72_01580 [Solirubrobacterales bacterium]|nr:hypothetical protein [Solirubrobacterales bacterium]